MPIAKSQRFTQYLVAALAVIVVFWHLYFAFFFPVPEKPHVVIHWGLLLGVFYLSKIDFEPAGRRDYAHNLLTVVMFVATVVVTVYAYTHIDPEWIQEAKMLLIYGTTDLAVGAVAIIITLHASYLAFGRAMFAVGIGGLIYALYGNYFPGILNHGGIELERLLFSTTITLGDGVWGYLMEVGATWVVIFIFYAGMVEGYGGMEYITNLGYRLGQRMEGGVVQIAVITSFIVGSVMGGSVSNVATTGSFTIPMMKDNGVQPKIAGAIESIASTGGQILPPVMGSAAFIMADILGISYFDVIIGAVLPALLFYLPVAFIVFLSNRKHKWGFDDDAMDLDPDNAESKADDESEVDADLDVQETVESQGFFRTLARGLPYILSFLVLIYFLMIEQSDPLYSGAYATVSMMVFAIPRYLVIEGFSIDAARGWLEGTVQGCTEGAKNMAPLTAVLSMLGVVVTILTQSGFTQDFSFLVLNSYQGIGLLLLILVMAMSILFGMGMPSAPAYIVVAIVSAPVLVSVGIEPLVAHLYVFYFALLSTITPPVALSSAMAAGIAGASFYDTAKETLRLGIYSFIVPFVFVYSPSLVLWDNGTPVAFAVGIFGICSLGFALVGHNGRRDLTSPERVVFTVLSLSVLFVPNVVSNALLWPLVGITVAFIVLTLYLSSLQKTILARVGEI